MTTGTYKVANKLDGMAYGGSSGNIERRRREHRRDLRNGTHHCIRLQRAWNKYGKDVFGFIPLEVIEDYDERLAAEQIWLDVHHAAGACYNIAITAGPAGPKSEEHKRRIGDANRGKKHTEEQNRRHSERMMGKQYALGYRHTGEWKQAQSERMMGSPITDAAKLKIGDALAKPYPAFIHRDTGEIIPAGRNMERLCRERGLHPGCMGGVKNGERPHHKGWILLDSALVIADDGE